MPANSPLSDAQAKRLIKMEWQGLNEGSEAFDKELARLKGAQEAQRQAMPDGPQIELPGMREEQTTL